MTDPEAIAAQRLEALQCLAELVASLEGRVHSNRAVLAVSKAADCLRKCETLDQMNPTHEIGGTERSDVCAARELQVSKEIQWAEKKILISEVEKNAQLRADVLRLEKELSKAQDLNERWRTGKIYGNATQKLEVELANLKIERDALEVAPTANQGTG